MKVNDCCTDILYLDSQPYSRPLPLVATCVISFYASFLFKTTSIYFLKYLKFTCLHRRLNCAIRYIEVPPNLLLIVHRSSEDAKAEYRYKVLEV